MKRVISLALVFVLCLSLCACGDPASKLEKQVKEDLFNQLDRDYFVREIEVTVRKTNADGEYHYISGEVEMKAWDAIDYKYVILETDFEGKYRLNGGSFVKVSLYIDDDWSFVTSYR